MDDYERDRANQDFAETEEEIEYRRKKGLSEEKRELDRRNDLINMISRLDII